MLWLNSGFRALEEETFEAFMLKGANHSPSVT